MKNKAKSLLKQIRNLQSKIYNFQMELEEKAEETKNDFKREKLNLLAKVAGCSGFELDESARHMEDVIDG